MDNLRTLLGVGRMDRVLNTRIKELFEVTKEVDERIGEGVFRWFGHVGKKGNFFAKCERNI